jgi:hypothetical protein
MLPNERNSEKLQKDGSATVSVRMGVGFHAAEFRALDQTVPYRGPASAVFA